MKIYLDTNLWCRPYDDLDQERILEEAEAFNKISFLSYAGFLNIVTSDVVIAEISLISDLEKKDKVESLVYNSANQLIQTDEEMVNLADKIKSAGKLKDFMDALHIAVSAQVCKYFLSCDDELIKKASLLRNGLQSLGYDIKIKNSLDFLRELEVIR